MNDDVGSGEDRSKGGLTRGIVSIVATGVALGVVYNALGLVSEPPRGLSWLAKEVRLESFEDLQSPSSPGAPAGDGRAPTSGEPATPTVAPRPDADGSPSPPVASTATEMSDPMGFAAAPTAELPDIPDVGRPLQMQLAAVKRFFDAGAAVIVDAREPGEYSDGRIAGAINLPYDEVITDTERLERFQADGKPIIIYCGGGTCELSMNLGFALVAAGQKKVLVFLGGFPEWQAAGYPVERGGTADEAKE